jgi:hypothetical protein
MGAVMAAAWRGAGGFEHSRKPPPPQAPQALARTFMTWEPVDTALSAYFWASSASRKVPPRVDTAGMFTCAMVPALGSGGGYQRTCRTFHSERNTIPVNAGTHDKADKGTHARQHTQTQTRTRSAGVFLRRGLSQTPRTEQRAQVGWPRFHRHGCLQPTLRPAVAGAEWMHHTGR